jgi:hypothetical protein
VKTKRSPGDFFGARVRGRLALLTASSCSNVRSSRLSACPLCQATAVALA